MKLKIVQTLNDMILKLFSIIFVLSAGYIVYIIGLYFILVAFSPSTLQTFNHKLNLALLMVSMLGFMFGHTLMPEYHKRFDKETKESHES